jgi:hypothetical protein
MVFLTTLTLWSLGQAIVQNPGQTAASPTSSQSSSVNAPA